MNSRMRELCMFNTKSFIVKIVGKIFLTDNSRICGKMENYPQI